MSPLVTYERDEMWLTKVMDELPPNCAFCLTLCALHPSVSVSDPASRATAGIGGTRFISFEDRHWHNDCFICATCGNSLVGKGFITDGADILCPECAKQRLM